MSNRTETDHHAPRANQLSPVLKQVLPADGAFDLPRWVIDHSYVLGRDPGSPDGIALPDDSKVSKQHLRLRPLDALVEVEDLGSKNHTFVNGQPTSRTQVGDGCVLRVGNTLFVLRFEPLHRGDAPRAESAVHERLLGQSPEVRALRASLSQVAKSIDPVLLLGPTGAGKELAAQSVHALSPRHRGPFVAVNCAAIPAGTAESTLFGHERGAFTGATQSHEGAFRKAHGGTLFLDEVGELPLDLQAKLLRALQPLPQTRGQAASEGRLRIQPMGSERVVDVDLRIIAATNVDMGQALSSGKFREDLWQRLAVLPVQLPSLAQRRDDILPLFFHILNAGQKSESRRISARLGELLLVHRWPGNVRELENVAKRMRLLGSPATPLDIDDLPDDLLRQLAQVTPVAVPVSPASPQGASPAQGEVDSRSDEGARPLLTREILERLLLEHQGNRSIIARILRRDRKTIRRRMDELGIPRNLGKPDGDDGDDD